MPILNRLHLLRPGREGAWLLQRTEKAEAGSARTKRLFSLFYKADERIRVQLLSILLPASVFLSLGINVLFSCIIPDLVPAQTVGQFPGPGGILLQAFFYSFFIPYIEETVFEIMFPRLQRWYGTGTAILPSALFFGLYHGNVSQGIYAFIAVILFFAAYEASGSFAVPFALHGACNLAVLFLQWTVRIQNRI